VRVVVTEAGGQAALAWMRVRDARVEAGERCWRRRGVSVRKIGTGGSKQSGEFI
jgi:hypothetical protein